MKLQYEKQITEVVIPSEQKNIGISLSGGLDSSLLLFIICSIAIVAISRDEYRETQSVLEKEEEENSNLPQIPQSK